MYDELIKRLRRWANSFCGCCKHADKKQKACDDCTAVYGSLWEAADAIEDLITALTASNEVIAKSKPKWIPVTERLPEDYEQVLTCDERGNIHIFPHLRHFKYPFGIRPEDPRYFMPKWWMPLPQPPKEG